MRRPLVLAACLTAALAGCGGGGAKHAGKVLTVERGRVVPVTGREYSFTPDRVVVLGGGGRVTVRFTNAGSLAHDLRVFRGDREVGGTPAFQGGSRTATLRLGPGDYRMVCTVGDHAQLGMRALLRVRARN
jgi:plastocyanin